MKNHTLAGLIAGLSLAAGMASATVVYDNGLPNATNGFGISNSLVTRDDFTLGSAATVTGVTFYFQNFNGITGWNQDITYQFSTDVGGTNILASGQGQNLTAVDSGLAWCCGGNAFRVDFDLQSNFNAAAGTTYWLGLTGATGTSNEYWVTTDFVNGSSVSSSVDFAFALNSQAATIPLPAGLPLVLTSLAGLAALRLRRQGAA